MLLLAATGLFGSVIKFFGAFFIVFWSLPWCLIADYFHAQQGSMASLFFCALGVVINSLLIWRFEKFCLR